MAAATVGGRKYDSMHAAVRETTLLAFRPPAALARDDAIATENESQKQRNNSEIHI